MSMLTAYERRADPDSPSATRYLEPRQVIAIF